MICASASSSLASLVKDTLYRLSDRPSRYGEHRKQFVELRRSSQFDDRQVRSVRKEADAQFQPRTATAANVSRRPGTRRSTRPPLAWLKSRPMTSGHHGAVGLLRSCATQRLVRPVAVVPVDVQRQLAAEGVTLVRDQQPTRALVLDRSDQPLDHGDAAVLADCTKALLYTPAAAPSPESFVRELGALVGDQMPRQSERPAQGSSQNGSDRSGRWLLLEHGKSHDPPREVIGDDGDPPAEWPPLG